MSKVCFFEGENMGFGVIFNAEYLLERLLEVELKIVAKNTEVVFSFKKSNNSLVIDGSNDHLFKAFFTNQMTVGKAGEYDLQVRVVDSLLGTKKIDIAGVHIHKPVIDEATGNLVTSNVLTHVIEVNITESLATLGTYNVNVLGATPKILIPLTNATTGHIVTHNLNCQAVKALFFDNVGEPEFNFLYRKINGSSNELECLFPTNDPYTGTLYIEKLF